jgi:hypothetical protein
MGPVFGKVTSAQIIALKQHVVSMTSHAALVKAQLQASKAALAALDQTAVNAAVVPGYPPSAV